MYSKISILEAPIPGTLKKRTFFKIALLHFPKCQLPHHQYSERIYCKYYSQGIVVFLVTNAHVDGKYTHCFIWWPIRPILMMIGYKNPENMWNGSSVNKKTSFTLLVKTVIYLMTKIINKLGIELSWEACLADNQFV